MLSLLLIFSSLAGVIQQDWTWSVHPEAHFKVLTPFSLTLSTRELPTAYDPILYQQYIGGSLTDSTLALAFVIDHYQLPVESDSIDDAYSKELFENTVDEILASVGGELIYMDFNNGPERDICIWKAAYLNEKGTIRGNLIIAGDQYYGLQAFGLTKDHPDALMNKFLDSFKIIN